MTDRVAAVILAAGVGRRMKSRMAKVLHPLAGRSMIAHVIAAAASVTPERTIIVIGPQMESVRQAVQPCLVAVQSEALGTAHAVQAARTALAGFTGDVLVLFGADPLVTADSLQRLLDARRRHRAAVAVLGFRPDDPDGYGRLVEQDGVLTAIVESADADDGQKAITLCNSGVMALDGARMWPLLDAIGNDNRKGEFYLTDIVARARAGGHTCVAIEGPADDHLGVDSRADLAAAECIMQNRLRSAAMAAGATLIDPASVFLSWDTRLAPDVVVEPHVFFGPGVSVGAGATVRAFSHIEGAAIASGAVVGPFVRLRPGADIGEGARVGNFVEIKATRLGAGAKASHLSYLGDADIGAAANIGAGVITANYDGAAKHHTTIGANASIGADSVLVAPVTVGDGVVVGAGSVIDQDVPADALAVGRSSLVVRDGAGKRLRQRNAKRARAASPPTSD
ncbi:MAG: bifunctional UDP-N-acetylglucosamine diphosphorylase/glucosamine-1-phosphate N-acetyltransferase GlmU [Alphaproteobacteria bacterium]